MKASLEALVNIGTVSVTRSAPSYFKEYSWSITFMSMPGSFPIGAGTVSQLVPAYSGLLQGVNSAVVVTTPTPGIV